MSLIIANLEAMAKLTDSQDERTELMTLAFNLREMLDHYRIAIEAQKSAAMRSRGRHRLRTYAKYKTYRFFWSMLEDEVEVQVRRPA